jgi:hypothetical protein
MKILAKTCLFVVLSLMALTSPSRAGSLEIFNPDWSIVLTDFGYSDFLFDQRAGFEGREYLSGEWGAAVGYTKGATVSPTWLEPNFLFPDWETNSNFEVITTIAESVSADPTVIASASSVIGNGDLAITQIFEMIDTTLVGTLGIAQGFHPASAGDPGSSITSSRYVMRHTYQIENVSGTDITDLNLFQFLHSLHANTGVYDDRDYGGTFGDYMYDITQRGVSEGFGGGEGGEEEEPPLFEISEIEPGNYLFDDLVAFHSKIAPTAWEVGRYGDDTVDDHVSGKPSVGTHLSVEADSLSGTDFFAPPNLWVGGAQKFGVTSLLTHGSSVSFDVLLSISTTQQFIPEVPEPSSLVLMGLGLIGLCGMHRRRRRSV